MPKTEGSAKRNFGHALPGTISWIVIVATVLGTMVYSQAWLATVTVFFAYFILRSSVTSIFAIIGEVKIRKWQRRDWSAGEDEPGKNGFAPSEVRHIVIIPNYREPDGILRRTLDALAAQHRANERMIVVLGMEEREPDAQAKGDQLAADYAHAFRNVLVTVHPANLPGDEPGKSSNEAWAAVRARAALDGMGVDLDLCTITSCDADSVIHPSYFAAVARSFADHERRDLTFWQAPLLYYNNIWNVPAPIRMNTWLSHAVQIADLAMPFYTPLPISTYTLSLRLAERCGWWDPAVIPEDWHEYLNCTFTTGERIGTESVFLPTMADATDGNGWFKALSNRFHQVKRHAWGAEDVGYIWGRFAESPDCLRPSTFFRFIQVLTDHVLRVAAPFCLVSLYGLTAYYSTIHIRGLARRIHILDNLALNRVLFILGGAIMVMMILLELWRCPPRSILAKFAVVPEIIVMWLMLPVIGFYLGALPALTAQTRLMFGIPLGYRLTPKRFVESTATTLLK
ncbi:MAG: glycosyltransferase [Coriobacteriia bacterium]